MRQLIIICLYFALLFILAWYIGEIGARNARRAKEYFKLHNEISELVRIKERNEANFDMISGEIERLRGLKHKEPKLTDDLEDEFLKQLGRQ